jgi:trypsin-like peptidase
MKMRVLPRLLSGGIAAMAICLPSVAAAQSNPEGQRAVVVRLHTHFATGKDETAAGVFVGKDKQNAYFITARHAIAEEVDNQEVHAQSTNLWFYGSPQSLRAVVFDRTDAILDLGVVYVTVENLPPDLPQIVRKDAAVNGSVHIVGHPAAGDWSVWEGTIQNDNAPNGDVHHFVTTANPSLAKGYSGGPVFDPDGNFLGMHTETTASYGTAAKSAEIVDKLKAWQVPTTNLTDIPVAEQTPPGPTADFPSGSKRVYSAAFSEWPISNSQQGSISLGFGNTYVLKPASNTWIGPGRPMAIPSLQADFVLDVRFRITEKNPSTALSLNLLGTGDDADSVDAYLELWSSENATYTLYKGRVKRTGLPVAHSVTEEVLAERVALPSSIAAHSWSQGGKITLKREGGKMAFFVNDEFIKDFAVSLFPFNEIGLGVAFPSTVEITSIEARIRP